MQNPTEFKRPTKREQELAIKSFEHLEAALAAIKTEDAEIEIEETKEIIKLPVSSLRVLAEVLKAMSDGIPISIVPIRTELTTQAAADMLGCSRPHLVKLLESGRIPFSKVGRHRRVRMEDLLVYKKELRAQQRHALIQLMANDEENGLYDT